MNLLMKYMTLLCGVALIGTSCSNLEESSFKVDDSSEIYSEPFTTTMGSFKAVSVKGEQVWTMSSNNYISMSGYRSSDKTNHENEDWLISADIDLTKVTASYFSFDYVAHLMGNVAKEATVWVSENYKTDSLPQSATWDSVPARLMDDPGNYVFTSSGQMSLDKYAGKKIRIAIKYLSTDTKAGTFELKNFLVSRGTAAADKSNDGSEAKPYTVAEASLKGDGSSAWIRGYVVGYIWKGNISNNYILSSDTCTQTMNILIADTSKVDYYARTIIVQLPRGVVREALNLANDKNKSLIGKKVDLLGVITKSDNMILSRYVSKCKLPDGSKVEDPYLGLVGNGTEASPYNVIAAILNQGSKKWVEGYIVGNVDGQGVSISSESKFTAPFTIQTNVLLASSPDENDYSMCIPVQLPAGAIRNAFNLSSNSVLLKQKVRLYGSLETYFSTAGLKSVTYGYLPNGTAVGTKPVIPIFSEPFAANSKGNFTVNNVKLPDGFTSVWLTSSSYGMVATAFKTPTNFDSESWLISPEIDLTNEPIAKLTFDHAINFVTIANIKNEMTVHVSLDNGTTWTQLTVPTYPPGNKWDFVNAGEIDLAAYVGKKIRIAFKYVSTSTKAGTWEVKNVMIYKPAV